MVDYLDILGENIARLIEKRRTLDFYEQEKINKKLDKLYELKYVAISQKK